MPGYPTYYEIQELQVYGDDKSFFDEPGVKDARLNTHYTRETYKTGSRICSSEAGTDCRLVIDGKGNHFKPIRHGRGVVTPYLKKYSLRRIKNPVKPAERKRNLLPFSGLEFTVPSRRKIKELALAAFAEL